MKLAQKIWVPALSVALVAGCATPINSARDDGKEPIEGFTYHLTRTKSTITVAVRLESCDPIKVVLLPPKAADAPIADPEFTFRIDPQKAYNLFKSVSDTEVVLTADRRLGSGKAKTEDASVALLTPILKWAELNRQAAAANSGAFSSMNSAARIQSVETERNTRALWRTLEASKAGKNATEPEFQAKKPNVCSNEARRLLTLADRLEKARKAEIDKELDFLQTSKAFDKDGLEKMKAFAEARSIVEKDLQNVHAALTKSLELTLSPSANDTSKSVVGGIDLQIDWLTNYPLSNDKAQQCTAPTRQPIKENKETERMRIDSLGNEQLLDAKQPCVYFMVSAKRPALGEATASPQPGDSVDALLYRLPKSYPWTLHTRAAIPDGFMFYLATENGTALDQNEFSNLVTDELTKTLLVGSGQARIAQWGRIARLRYDLGPFGSSGVNVEFDDWSIPKKVGWNAQAGGLAGLLGLANTYEANKQKAEAPPDPSAALKGELLQKLLSECLNAQGTTSVASCAGLLK